MGLFQPAVKEKLKARVAIDGPTGSGKTWTALQWARILAGPDGPIGVIDTENRSAAYYAAAPGTEPTRVNWWDPPYVFGHLPKKPPYDPRELRELVIAAGHELGPDGVLVIDSLTHYWNGEGGTLDVVDDAAARSGNSFAGWKEGTPAQRGMLDAIIHAECHVIVTMRSKMEYVLDQVVKNGKTIQVPRKVGMAPEQRAGVEYEFTVVADMDLDHRLLVSKSRCDVIADEVAPNGRSYEVAQAFADWLSTGATRLDEGAVKSIVAMFDSIEDEGQRKATKAAFVQRFGPPADLLDVQLEAVYEWINDALGDAAPAQGTLDGTATEATTVPCACGQTEGPAEAYPTGPTEPEGVIHRTDGPCYHAEASDQPADDGEAAPADPEPEPETAPESPPDGPESDATAIAPPPTTRARRGRGAASQASEAEPQQVTGSLAEAIGDE